VVPGHPPLRDVRGAPALPEPEQNVALIPNSDTKNRLHPSERPCLPGALQPPAEAAPPGPPEAPGGLRGRRLGDQTARVLSGDRLESSREQELRGSV